MSFAASGFGIWYAVEKGAASDGQSGGAVAISFLFLFAAKPTPAVILDGIPGAPTFDEDAPEAQILRLRNALSVLIDAQMRERVFLSIASVQGTLVWAFGDRAALFLGAPVVACPC